MANAMMIAISMLMGVLGLMGLVRRLSAEPRGTEKRKTESRTFGGRWRGEPESKTFRERWLWNPKTKLSGNGGWRG